MKRSSRASGREGGERRTNFLSNLLHKSRDIGKRVSRFLCNEFAVRREGKEGSKSRPGCGARLISPFTSGVFAETARHNAVSGPTLAVAILYSPPGLGGAAGHLPLSGKIDVANSEGHLQEELQRQGGRRET